jgi:hypothetical protein
MATPSRVTHKTASIRNRLAKRPRYHVHFTPTSASPRRPPGLRPRGMDRASADARWINQVERWFGLLTERALRRGVHRSVADLERDIRAFIEATNADPKPFRRVETADDILASVERFCPRTLGASATDQPLAPTSESGH